jgi:hypothetical protein
LSKFGVICGLRQGDTLSPLPFNLIVEGLSVLITRAINGGLFLSIEIEEVFQVSHLQLAYTTLIFFLKDITVILDVQRTLR